MRLGTGLKGKLAITTAVVAFFAGYGRRAYAQNSCTPAGGPTYAWSGPTAPSTTQQTFTGTNVTVNATGFIVNATTVPSNAISITGDGVMTFNELGGSVITTTTPNTGYRHGYSLYMHNTGATGSINVTTSATSVLTGGYVGIRTINNGSGATNIVTSGEVYGPVTWDPSNHVGANRGIGIYAINTAFNNAGLSITTNGPVTGSRYGIVGYQFGYGTLTINANNRVIGYGSATKVPADGIFARNNSNETTTITVGANGVVEGYRSAIRATSYARAVTTITNNGTVRNLTGSPAAVAITTSGTPVTITNNGALTGIVDLGAPSISGPSTDPTTLVNRIVNNGTWDTSGGTNLVGGNAANIVLNSGTIVASEPGAAAATVTTFNGVGTFQNAGIITMQNGVAGDRTIVQGNFVGQGGTVVLDTVLGGTGSPSDMLVIDGGTASGTTNLRIVNAGGAGALTTADGIRVVDAINGATTDPGSFRLSAAVVAGAFEYSLFYGGVGADANDQDWYLRSIATGGGGQGPQGQALSPSAQTALPYAEILSNYAYATLATLQQRTGNRIWPNGAPDTVWCKDPSQNYRCSVSPTQAGVYAAGTPALYAPGAWGRIVGQYASYDPKKGSSYTQGLGFLQAGYEGAAYENALGALSLGVFATVGTSDADIDVTRDPVTGASRKGKITTTGYGVGGNVTWLGNSGLYADAVGQLTWYSSDLTYKAGGNNQGWSSALSLEVGQRFDLGSGWSVVPQAQLAWTHVDFNSFNDIYGARISLGDGDSLRGRAGVRVENLQSWKDANGQVQRLQLYGIANLSYEFLNGTKVNVAGVSLEQQEKKLWGEVGVGATYAWNDKWSGYGEVDYATALSSNSGSDNYAVKGSVGLRYRW